MGKFHYIVEPFYLEQFIFRFHCVIKTLRADVILEEKLKKWIDFFDQAGIRDSTNIRKFAQKFDDEKIDDDIIQTLTEQDLKDFGVDAKGDRLRILKRVSFLFHLAYIKFFRTCLKLIFIVLQIREINKIELAADPAISVSKLFLEFFLWRLCSISLPQFRKYLVLINQFSKYFTRKNNFSK